VSLPADRPDAARRRFERALARSRREQTALLDWLAASSNAEALRRGPADADPEATTIDLRRETEIDLRTDAVVDHVVDDVVIDLRDRAVSPAQP
jgi:hypothetical protein